MDDNCFIRYRVCTQSKKLKEDILVVFDIALDKDWKQLGIYPPLFGLIGYFKF